MRVFQTVSRSIHSYATFAKEVYECIDRETQCTNVDQQKKYMSIYSAASGTQQFKKLLFQNYL